MIKLSSIIINSPIINYEPEFLNIITVYFILKEDDIRSSQLNV